MWVFLYCSNTVYFSLWEWKHTFFWKHEAHATIDENLCLQTLSLPFLIIQSECNICSVNLANYFILHRKEKKYAESEREWFIKFGDSAQLTFSKIKLPANIFWSIFIGVHSKKNLYFWEDWSFKMTTYKKNIFPWYLRRWILYKMATNVTSSHLILEKY